MVWKNVLEPDRLQITIHRVHVAYWILKATDTHSVYVILIVFPQQQLLHDRACLFQDVLSSRSALVALIDFAVIPAA
jgi:hypothetical protein